MEGKRKSQSSLPVRKSILTQDYKKSRNASNVSSWIQNCHRYILSWISLSRISKGLSQIIPCLDVNAIRAPRWDIHSTSYLVKKGFPRDIPGSSYVPDVTVQWISAYQIWDISVVSTGCSCTVRYFLFKRSS